jgi:hypothetical protein
VAGYGGAKGTTLNIGKASTLNTNNWAGYFASFYVWNRKLTSTEVGNLFGNTRGRFGV